MVRCTWRRPRPKSMSDRMSAADSPHRSPASKPVRMNADHLGYSAVAASTSCGPSSWAKYFGCRAFALRLAAGILSYNVSDKSKNDIFHDFLPLLNGQLIELLDRKAGIVQERAIRQLLALERTVSKQGKDTIGHRPRRRRRCHQRHRRSLPPGSENAERSREGRQHAQTPERVAKDVKSSQTQRPRRGAAKRTDDDARRRLGRSTRSVRVAKSPYSSGATRNLRAHSWNARPSTARSTPRSVG